MPCRLAEFSNALTNNDSPNQPNRGLDWVALLQNLGELAIISDYRASEQEFGLLAFEGQWFKV
jgi:hypothetical protein